MSIQTDSGLHRCLLFHWSHHCLFRYPSRATKRYVWQKVDLHWFHAHWNLWLLLAANRQTYLYPLYMYDSAGHGTSGKVHCGPQLRGRIPAQKIAEVLDTNELADQRVHSHSHCLLLSDSDEGYNLHLVFPSGIDNNDCSVMCVHISGITEVPLLSKEIWWYSSGICCRCSYKWNYWFWPQTNHIWRWSLTGTDFIWKKVKRTSRPICHHWWSVLQKSSSNVRTVYHFQLLFLGHRLPARILGQRYLFELLCNGIRADNFGTSGDVYI